MGAHTSARIKRLPGSAQCRNVHTVSTSKRAPSHSCFIPHHAWMLTVGMFASSKIPPLQRPRYVAATRGSYLIQSPHGGNTHAHGDADPQDIQRVFLPSHTPWITPARARTRLFTYCGKYTVTGYTQGASADEHTSGQVYVRSSLVY